MLIKLGDFLIGWLIYLSVQTFQPIIWINRWGNWGCTYIYRPLSYPFRSLIDLGIGRYMGLEGGDNSSGTKRLIITLVGSKTLGTFYQILIGWSKITVFLVVTFIYTTNNYNLQVGNFRHVYKCIVHCLIPKRSLLCVNGCLTHHLSFTKHLWWFQYVCNTLGCFE